MSTTVKRSADSQRNCSVLHRPDRVEAVEKEPKTGMTNLSLAHSVNAINVHAIVTKLLAMTSTHYIAETDGRNAIAAVWFKPKGRKSPRVFDIAKDSFDPNEAAEFSGASEAEITRWLLARSKPFSG